MTINERVKEARKALNLTQIEFGDKVGISQGHLTSIENGKRTVTEKTIIVICAAFGLDENWLRTGEGNMFIETDSTIVSEVASAYHLGDIDREILRIFLELDSNQRQVVKSFAFSLVDAVLQNPTLHQEYENGKSPESSSILKTISSIEKETQAEAEQFQNPKSAWEKEADEFAEIARQQYLAEKKRESGTLSVKKFGVG